MEHRDALMSEVTVIYDETPENLAEKILASLKSIGMEIEDHDPDEGCLDGVVPAHKLPEVYTVPGVKYVRITMEYIADYPTGDPRDLDKE